jgi:hypothetical protein
VIFIQKQLMMDEQDVCMMMTFPPGSSGGLDGLRSPQHLLDPV